MTEPAITAYKDVPFAPLAEGSPVEIAVLWGELVALVDFHGPVHFVPKA